MTYLASDAMLKQNLKKNKNDDNNDSNYVTK